MLPVAFVSSFTSSGLLADRSYGHVLRCVGRRRNVSTSQSKPRIVNSIQRDGHIAETIQIAQPTTNPRKRATIGIVGKAKVRKTTSTEVDSKEQKGLLGVKAKAYWDSMGVLPLFFAGFGVVALTIKMLKVKGGEWKSGQNGINKVTVPKTAITSEAEEAELHVFKCGGCGYEMYPARGRESVFFPDSFKCPLCKTPKSQFWDLNDPTDPRNQESDDESEEEEEEEEEGEGEEMTPGDVSTDNGSLNARQDEQQTDETIRGPAAKDSPDPDSS